MENNNLRASSEQRLQEFKANGIPSDSVFTPYDAAIAYSALSGACIDGTLSYVDRLIGRGKVSYDQKLTLPQILEIARGKAYFKNFEAAISQNSAQLMPFTSTWDLTISKDSKFYDLRKNDAYRILQKSSSAIFYNSFFSNLKYQIDTNTDTTFHNCSGGYLDMDIGTCGNVCLNNTRFHIESKIAVSTGHDVYAELAAQSIDIKVSSCCWYKFVVTNYDTNSPITLFSIKINIASAAAGQTHQVLLPLKTNKGEKIKYYLHGDEPTIIGDLEKHIVKSAVNAVNLDITLGCNAPLELCPR